jgi:hypothetical protein
MAKAGEYLHLLYAAKQSKCGIVVTTDDPARLRQLLYRVRKDVADPDLDELSFVESPSNPTEHLWIVRKQPDAQASPETPPQGDA